MKRLRKSATAPCTAEDRLIAILRAEGDLEIVSPRTKAKRALALNNTYSGILGEMAVASLLLRSGYKVAKPYWNNDVIDLIVLIRAESGHSYLPIPVQVKSVQLLGGTKKHDGAVRGAFQSQGATKGMVQRSTSSKMEVAIEGLRKEYIDRNPSLCLCIYSPEFNKCWFIPGAHNIRKVHEAGVEQSKARRGKPRTQYQILQPADDVPIHVNLDADPVLDKWLVDQNDPNRLFDKFFGALAKRQEPSLEAKVSAEALFELDDDESDASNTEVE